MLSNYRNINSAKAAPIITNTKNENAISSSSNKHHHKEHSKNQPILPEVGQYVYDSKTGKKYLRGKLMGKVLWICIFFLGFSIAGLRVLVL